MKVVRAIVEEFTPVSVTITFETQEEVDLIRDAYSVSQVVSLLGSSNYDCRQAVNRLLDELGSALEGSATPS